MRDLRIITALIVSAMAGGLGLTACSPMNKILKSGDVETIYQAGIDAYLKKDYKRATAYFETVYNDIYMTERVDTVLFYLAKSQYTMGHYDVSSEYFDQYRKNFGRQEFSEEAEYLLPMSYYHMSRPVERDQSETNKAMIAFNEYLNRYPNSIKADDIKVLQEELQMKLYAKAFLNASLYYKLEEYPAAVAALRNLLKESPETPYREEMMYLICKSWYNYAKNSIPERKLDRYMRMIDSYYNFIGEYPESHDYLQDLEKMFTDAKEYVDHNQQLSVDIEKNRIDIQTRKINIQQQKAALRKIKDQMERHAAKTKLQQDQAELKALETQIKNEAKKLKKSDSKKAVKKEAEVDIEVKGE